MKLLEFDLVEMRLLLIEVLRMQIEVRKLEEIEYLGVLFSAGWDSISPVCVMNYN